VTGSAASEQVESSARLFVALPVPPAVRRGLEQVRARLRERTPDLRFTRPEGWHVTLAFLGSVPAARIDEVGVVVRAGVADAAGVIGLRVAGPGRFGRHVLWVGVADDPPGAVAALGDRLQAAIAAAGLPVQRQEVRPHLTLARGGRGRPVRARHLDDLAEALDAVVGSGDAAVRVGGTGSGEAAGAAWLADEVQVWRSELGRGPARYHLVTRVPLRGGA
jgi:RNA 2',3'-cyclic 3'-phosphodiesterase